MGREKWIDATQKARGRRQIKQEVKNNPLDAITAETAQELKAFLKSPEGKDALTMLAENNAFIRFGMSRSGYPDSVVYLLMGKGLMRSIENTTMGYHIRYGRFKLPTPVKISEIQEFVREVISCDPNSYETTPNKFLTDLRERLDEVSDNIACGRRF